MQASAQRIRRNASNQGQSAIGSAIPSTLCLYELVCNECASASQSTSRMAPDITVRDVPYERHTVLFFSTRFPARRSLWRTTLHRQHAQNHFIEGQWRHIVRDTNMIMIMKGHARPVHIGASVDIPNMTLAVLICKNTRKQEDIGHAGSWRFDTQGPQGSKKRAKTDIYALFLWTRFAWCFL